jgi:hypothetical protein
MFCFNCVPHSEKICEGCNKSFPLWVFVVLQYLSYVGHFKSSAHCMFSSLKMNLFYKIHLQAFNVNSIVLYHSSSTFGQVLYSCLDAFVVDASYYSGHLIRHLLNASESLVGSAHQTLTCSQNWRNHSVGNASEPSSGTFITFITNV